MTPQEFRDIRKQLGLTQAELAALLGYAAAPRVAEYESTNRVRTIPPLLERLMRAYEAGYRPPELAERQRA